jgi:hypothetical protein
MHPTSTVPATGPVTVTAEQVANMRTYLLGQVRHSTESRHLFAEGWLTGAIQDLAREVTTPLERGIVARALAVIAAVAQLDAEADGFATTGRDNPETGQPLPDGVEGYSLGRHAR